MADHTTAVEAAPVPSASDIARAEAFAREPFLHEGETAGRRARRRAPPRRLRARRTRWPSSTSGAEVPSIALAPRLLAAARARARAQPRSEPHLADGTTLNPHQVDALSGTLTALLADRMRAHARRRDGADVAAPVSRSTTSPPRCRRPTTTRSPPSSPRSTRSTRRTRTTTPTRPPPRTSRRTRSEPADETDEDIDAAVLDDPNAHKRFWFEHATGAGKTVAAMGFVEASRTGGVLILTHRRNLVDQFIGELRDRGYEDRLAPPLLGDDDGHADGPVTVETYQWFVRNAGKISDAYSIVICDEAHTALGEKTSACDPRLDRPDLHRHDRDRRADRPPRHRPLPDPDLALRPRAGRAPRRDRAAALHPHPAGPGRAHDRQGAAAQGRGRPGLRPGELAELLDQAPFNFAIADLYKTRFNGVPGVVYTAGVQHAYNVAEAFRDARASRPRPSPARRPSASWPRSSPRYERGEIDVLVNAQLLAEGWNSPRATVCMHLAPTASQAHLPAARRPRHAPPPGQGGGRRRRLRPPGDHATTTRSSRCTRCSTATSTAAARSSSARCAAAAAAACASSAASSRSPPTEERRHADLRARAVADRRRAPRLGRAARVGGARRRARAAERLAPRPRDAPLRPHRRAEAPLPAHRGRAQQELAAAHARAAGDRRAEGPRGVRPRHRHRRHLGARRAPRGRRRSCCRRSPRSASAAATRRNAWIWRLAEYTREVHEEYAVQRWPETKRLLGLLVNSSGRAHARNARRLVQASRNQDRRLQAAMLAAAVAHTPEAEEVLRGARTRLARKPGALARELLRNFPKGKGRRGRRRKKKGPGENGRRPEARGDHAGRPGEDEGGTPEPPTARRRRTATASSRPAGAARARAGAPLGREGRGRRRTAGRVPRPRPGVEAA